MTTEDISEYSMRLARLNAIKDSGHNPFPAIGHKGESLANALNTPVDKTIETAGRLIGKREMGRLCFCHLKDASGKMQIAISEKELGKEKYKFFIKNFDLGDFISVTGKNFITHAGETTILVNKYTLLAKSLLPLPEKFHGLTDIEQRYRKRYLDLLSNDESMKIAKTRSLLVKELRNYFDAKGFFEVETPILQTLYGGALAKPFATHHNALDIPLYLRVAPELYLKRLIVGGFEKVYEIARCFRNEGIDNNHNPEFTQIEFYWAYADYTMLMDLVEDLLPKLINAVGLSLKFKVGDNEVDFTPPYPRVTMRELIKQYAKIDIEDYPDQKSILAIAKKLKVEDVDQHAGRGKLIDEIYKTFARPKIINPIFVIDHPIELSPLAKKKADNPKYVERFQLLCVGGNELCNAFSELNDPLDQEERFTEQKRLAQAGDEESMPYDEDYIIALKHGMPPTGGLGMGIDRLVKLLMNTDNLKEVILFPTMRPENTIEQTEGGKSDKTMVAHAILLNTPGLPDWRKLNTVAHLAASLAAREGKKLIYIDSSTTKDGEKIPMNIQHAIIIKQANQTDDLLNLKRKAEKEGVTTVCFTEEMQNSTDDKKVKKEQENKNSKEINFLGILIFGQKKTIENLTKEFKMMD